MKIEYEKKRNNLIAKMKNLELDSLDTSAIKEEIKEIEWKILIYEKFKNWPILISIDYSKEILVFTTIYSKELKCPVCYITIRNDKYISPPELSFWDFLKKDSEEIYHGDRMLFFVTNSYEEYDSYLAYNPLRIKRCIKDYLKIDLSVSLEQWRREWKGMTSSQVEGYIKWG